MAEESILAPKVEKLNVNGKLIGTFQGILDKVSKAPFYVSSASTDSVTVAVIESRNIKKQPYLFYIFNITIDSLEITYSIPNDTSETLRRAYVLRNTASFLSSINDLFDIDKQAFLQYVDSTLDKLLSGISQNYSVLFNKYDSLLSEYRAIKRLNIELSASNRNLSIQTADLLEENKKLKDSLSKLQKYSDQSLMSMVEDWINVHGSSIDVDEFAKTYNLTSPRVEEILDKMVSKGYIELRG